MFDVAGNNQYYCHMAEKAHQPVVGITDLDKFDLESERGLLWVPEHFKHASPDSHVAHEVVITGPHDIELPQSGKRYEIAHYIGRLLNALMHLPQTDRDGSFTARAVTEFDVPLDELKLGITKNIMSSTALKRAADALEHVGHVSFGVPIVDRISHASHINSDPVPSPSTKRRGFGSKPQYQIHPSVYFTDKRVT